MRHQAVCALEPNTDARDFSTANDEVGSRKNVDQIAVRRELAFGEDADGVALTDKLNCPANRFCVGGGLGYWECTPMPEEGADECPVEEVSAGHEVDQTGARKLNKDGVSVRDVVSKNEQRTALGDGFMSAAAHRREKEEKEKPKPSANERICDFD